MATALLSQIASAVGGLAKPSCSLLRGKTATKSQKSLTPRILTAAAPRQPEGRHFSSYAAAAHALSAPPQSASSPVLAAAAAWRGGLAASAAGPACSGMSFAQTAALHSSPAAPAAAAAAAAAVAESEIGAEDPFEGLYGDANLRDMMEPETLETPNARIAYHQVPAASSLTGVIFCGGLNSNMHGIKATMLEMHARRRGHPFVRFDYRGHGSSSGEFLDTTLGEWYEDTLAVIDRIALPGPHILVGSSIGGWIALKAAAARRERIKGLVLIAPAVDITELWWDGLSKEEQQGARETGFVPLGGNSKEGGRVRTSFFDEASDHCLLDTMAREVQVRCPVRILHGANDDVVPPFVANEVVNWLESRDVHLTIVKDGDHRLSRPEDLRSILTAVEELLSADDQRVAQ